MNQQPWYITPDQKIIRWAKYEKEHRGFPLGARYVVINDPRHFNASESYTDKQGWTFGSTLWFPSQYHYPRTSHRRVAISLRKVRPQRRKTAVLVRVKRKSKHKR
jgi:hypothetical protein